MVLTDDEVNARLESPANLMNRLNQINGSVQIVPVNPSDSNAANYAEDILPPSVDELIDNIEGRLTQGRIAKKSLELIEDSLSLLHLNLTSIEKPEKLSRIATDMGKVLDTFRIKKVDNSSNAPVIIWKPVMMNENRYESVIAHD